MKKVLKLVIIIAIFMSLLVGCGGKGTNSRLEQIKKSGELKFAMDATYPPMEFVDSKTNLEGFDVDISKAVAKKLGVKAKFINISFDGIFSALQAKKFDVVQCALSVTDERKKTVLFTKPYIYGGSAVYVKKGNSSIKSISNLNGKIAGCQVGTTAQESLSKINGIKKINKYNGSVEEFMDLANGRIDFVACDSVLGDYYALKNKGKVEKAGFSLTKEPIAVGFRKSDTALRDAYQKALDELKKDGTLSKLSIKWFGYDAYK